MQKNRLKLLVIVLCVGLLVAVFSGCSSAALTKPTQLADVPTYSVTGSCEIEINDRVVTVSGETDLMDGVLLYVSVHAQSGIELDSVTITKSGDQVSEEFVMTDDYYSDGVQSIVGYITCAPKRYGNQSESVYETYGDEFEYIETAEENQIWDKDGVIVLFNSELTPIEEQ